MNDRAITMEEFLADIPEEAIAEAKANGIELDDLAGVLDTYNSLDIDEPKYGEDTIGKLTEEELKLYVLTHTIGERLDDLQHDIGGTVMIATGKAYQQKATDLDGITDEMEAKAAEISEFYKCERLLTSYQSRLFVSICNRLGHWDWVLGIRTKQRIVKVKRKW